jgi:hypothetical protein
LGNGDLNRNLSSDGNSWRTNESIKLGLVSWQKDADVPGMKLGVVITDVLHLCCLLTMGSSANGTQVVNVTLVKRPSGVITTFEVVLTIVGEEETRKDVRVGLVRQIVDI